jgi:hypothetical protein
MFTVESINKANTALHWALSPLLTWPALGNPKFECSLAPKDASACSSISSRSSNAQRIAPRAPASAIVQAVFKAWLAVQFSKNNGNVTFE